MMTVQVQDDFVNFALPRNIYDDLSSSEKAALPRIFERFVASRAFRSTLTYDLDPINHCPSPPLSAKSSRGLTALSAPRRLVQQHHVDQRRISRFPLMELPAELRIMIAKYVLHVPEGLSWLWTNYRKGPRLATLEEPYSSGDRTLEKVNVLARVCKVLYAETKGLVLSLNVVQFSLLTSFGGRVPKKFYNDHDHSDGDLHGFEEALDFIRSSIPRNISPNLKHIQLLDFDFEDVVDHVQQFLRVMNNHRDLQVAVLQRFWILTPLSSDPVQKLADLEKEGEPFDSEEKQMQRRIRKYRKKGKLFQDLAEDVEPADRNWRIYPEVIKDEDMVKLEGFLTDEQQVLVRIWQEEGVQKVT